MSWKRESTLILDHKWDFIDIDDFISNSLTTRIKYAWVFILSLKSIMIYMADIAILVIMITSFREIEKLLTGEGTTCTVGPAICDVSVSSLKFRASGLIPIPARLGIVFGSMFFSFLFLIQEWRKARKIIKSRDISYSLTNGVAYRYFSIQSYPHFSFFEKIRSSRKTVDIFAFYVFFTFKGWKRLLLAEFPRQLIYGITVYDIITAQMQTLKYEFPNQIVKFFYSIYFLLNSLIQNNQIDFLIQYLLMMFTVLIWIISFISLIIAFFIYIPLIFEIRGNLKEYCCYKIDKRIDTLLKQKSRQRLDQSRLSSNPDTTTSHHSHVSLYSDSSVSLGRLRAAGGYRTAPPLGMTQGPALPPITINDFNAVPGYYSDYGGARIYNPIGSRLYDSGSEYSGSEGSRTDVSGPYLDGGEPHIVRRNPLLKRVDCYEDAPGNHYLGARYPLSDGSRELRGGC